MNTASRKSIAARKAQAVQFAAQTIVIDDDWRIVRADRLNWEVQYKGAFYGYYGRLLNAFQALPAKMLDAGAKDSLQRIQECQTAINERIATALKLKLG
jgi:hypothetical protein